MESVTVSVIIPVFNAAAYLGRCLDSVVGQRFPGGMEVVLVDDGSTDGSGSVCDRYADGYTNVRVIHTANRGASMARKNGLEQASGRYVTFVDSDDHVDPAYVETLYGLIKKSSCRVSACGAAKADGNAAPAGSQRVIPYRELMDRFFRHEFWSLWGKMFDRDLFSGVSFPEATISEDYAVMARLLRSAGEMAYESLPLYFHEERSGSLSRQRLSARAFEEFDNVLDVYGYTVREMPEYASVALANAVGTAVKLLKLSQADAAAYSSRRAELRRFLSSHRKDIPFNGSILWRTRILALLWS